MAKPLDENTIEEAIDLYEEGVSVPKIVNEAGISNGKLYECLKERGVERDRKEEKAVKCPECGKTFNSQRALNMHKSNSTFYGKVDEIVEKYNSGMTAEEVSEEVGIGKHSVIEALKNTGDIRSFPEAIELARKKGRLTGNKEPKIEIDINETEELSYILGVLKGDGWVNHQEKQGNYDVCLCSGSKQFCEEFARCLETFGLNPWVSDNRRADGMYCTKARSKAFYNWYKDLSEKKIEKIVRKNNSFKKAFIRAFYDSEGSLSTVFNGRSWELSICNTNKWAFELFLNLCEELGMNFKSVGSRVRSEGRKRIYEARLHKIWKVRNFLSTIEPTIEEKSIERIDNYVPNEDKVRCQDCGCWFKNEHGLKTHKKMKGDFDERKEFYENGMNDREIADRVGVSKTAVRMWRTRRNLSPNYSPSEGEKL